MRETNFEKESLSNVKHFPFLQALQRAKGKLKGVSALSFTLSDSFFLLCFWE